MTAGSRASPVSTSAGYPSARRHDLVEELHGRQIADPYRWLENADSAETREWVAAQQAGAPVAATGSVMVNGDAVYTTVGYTVAAAGCYTYTEALVGDEETTPTPESQPGKKSETVLVYPPNYSPPGLPTTGSDIGMIALGGLALVAMGGAAAFATRRRSRAITE